MLDKKASNSDPHAQKTNFNIRKTGAFLKNQFQPVTERRNLDHRPRKKFQVLLTNKLHYR